jgi:hypothetical protein
MNPLPSLSAHLGDHWFILGAGLCVAGMAFLIGRRFLIGWRSRQTPQGAPPAENFLHGVTSDRRAAARRRGNCVEVVLTDDEKTLRGLVVNRAIGGLCLLLDEPVAEGSTWKVRPSSADKAPWTPVLIRSCLRDGAQWDVGCQFTHTPSWNILVLFG